MARSAPISVRLLPEVEVRWRAAAEERGCSLSEFVKGCVEAELASGPATFAQAVWGKSVDDVKAAVVAPAVRPRRAGGACKRERHHRKGVWCFECGTTP